MSETHQHPHVLFLMRTDTEPEFPSADVVVSTSVCVGVETAQLLAGWLDTVR